MMNKKFEILLVLGVIIIIGVVAVGISAQIPINRIIQYKNPGNNYSSCCYVEETSESANVEGYQPYCCEEDENTSNYEAQGEYYPRCCEYEQPTYYNNNYRSGCH